MFSLTDSNLIFKFIAVIVGLVIHEFAHALAASALGDKTARQQGRVTLNPLAHLDPIGLLMILFAPVGWARPVQVNGLNFRRPRLYMSLVALAGPFSNLILSILALLALRYQGQFGSGSAFMNSLLEWGFIVNASLFVFNLIPIPPLDGSRILAQLIPYRWEPFYHKFELYGPFLLLLFFIIPQLSQYTFLPLFQFVVNLLAGLFGPSF